MFSFLRDDSVADVAIVPFDVGAIGPFDVGAIVPFDVGGGRGRGLQREGGRGRGRSRGYTWSESHRSSAAQGQLKRSLEVTQQKLKQTKTIHHDIEPLEVSRTFGAVGRHTRGKGTAKSDQKLYIRGKTIFRTMLVGKTQLRRFNRGLASHRRATRSALPVLLSGKSSVIVSVVMDDANMWVQRACGKVQLRSVAERRGTAKTKGGPKGRNVHVPALNVCQNIIARSSFDQPPCAIQLHTPTQVLPEAKWPTVRQRWAQWGISGWRAGRKLAMQENGVDLQLALDNVAVGAILITKDGLGVNTCIIADEAQRLAKVRSPGILRVLLEMTCRQHSVCLATAPVLRGLGDLKTVLVKLGHLFESSRTFGNFLDCCDKLVEDNFDIKQVPDASFLPAEAADWRRSAYMVLEASKVSLDLTDVDIYEILRIDNGNWDSPDFIHYCLPDCPAGCKGDRTIGLGAMKGAVRKSVGMGLVVALFYRQKHFEKANAYLMRGRGQHSILPRALMLLFPPKVIKQAEAAVAAASVVGDSEVSFQVE
jgi:hypothetical protein